MLINILQCEELRLSCQKLRLIAASGLPQLTGKAVLVTTLRLISSRRIGTAK
jgi:hypothetical protein